MVKEIKWTPEAERTFESVINYLKIEWSEKEVASFVESTDTVIDYIAEYPYMFRRAGKKNIREALITPHNLLIYKILKHEIHLITFWDTRQHPRKKKY
jgi:plasmid stabilization system protein ParE